MCAKAYKKEFVWKINFFSHEFELLPKFAGLRQNGGKHEKDKSLINWIYWHYGIQCSERTGEGAR